VIPDEAIQIWPQKKEKLRSDFLFSGVLKASEAQKSSWRTRKIAKG
jgi:hypothetical protein